MSLKLALFGTLAQTQLATAGAAAVVGHVIGLNRTETLLGSVNTIGAQTVLGITAANAVFNPLWEEAKAKGYEKDWEKMALRALIGVGVGTLLAGLDGFQPDDVKRGLLVGAAVMSNDYLVEFLMKLGSDAN